MTDTKSDTITRPEGTTNHVITRNGVKYTRSIDSSIS